MSESSLRVVLDACVIFSAVMLGFTQPTRKCLKISQTQKPGFLKKPGFLINTFANFSIRHLMSLRGGGKTS